MTDTEKKFITAREMASLGAGGGLSVAQTVAASLAAKGFSADDIASALLALARSEPASDKIAARLLADLALPEPREEDFVAMINEVLVLIAGDDEKTSS